VLAAGFGPISDQDHGGFDEVLVKDAALGAYLFEADEGVGVGLVDGDFVAFEGAVSVQDVIEIDELLAEVDLEVLDR
jgi:hypothetical protein